MPKFMQHIRDLICPPLSYIVNHTLSLSTNNTNKYIIMTSHYSLSETLSTVISHSFDLKYIILLSFSCKACFTDIIDLLFIYLPHYSFTYVTMFHVNLTYINNFTIKLFNPIVPNLSCQNLLLQLVLKTG